MNTEPINLDNIDDIVFDDAPATPPVDTTPPGTEPPVDPNVEPETPPAEPKTTFEPRVDVVDPETPPTDTPPEGVPPENPEADLFLSVAEILKGRGFFSGVDGLDKINNEEALAEAFDKEVQSRLTDRQKEILKYMNKGVDVTKVDKLNQAIKETRAITPDHLKSDVNLSKRIIATELHHKGIDKDMISTLVSTMEKDGALVDNAVKFLGERTIKLQGMLTEEIDRADQAERDAAKRKAEQEAAFQERLESKELFGRKITKTTVDKMKTIQNTVVGYTQDGQALNALMKYKLENPEEFEHKLLYLFAATNGLSNLDAFDRSAESRVAGRLRNAVRTMTSSQEIQNKTNANPVTKLNMDEIDDIV